MKQFLLLIVTTMASGIAAPYHPFWGLLLYYFFAVLRPQHLWEWALPVQWRWSLFAALIVLGATAMNMHRVIRRVRFSPIIFLLIGFGILLIFSALNAHNPGIAQYWAVEYGKIMLIALIALFMIDQYWQINLLSLAILVSIGYISWEINFMYFFENRRLDVYHHGYGGLDNNGAGLMLAMGVPFAFAFALTAADRWKRIAAGLLGLFMIHAVMMTYSRGAMLAGVLGIGWLIFQHRARFQAAAVAIVLASMIMLMAGPEIRDRFMSSTEFQEDSSAQSRLESWSAAWAIAWDHPLTGTGLRNSSGFTKAYGADRQGRVIHSVYLQIAADAGIPAMLIYIAVVISAFVATQSVRRRCVLAMQGGPDRGPPSEALFDEADRMEKTAISIQGSLLIFAFGAIFLSMESFELPWLLIVMAGVFPAVTRIRLDQMLDETPEDESPVEFPTTRGGAPAIRRNIRAA